MTWTPSGDGTPDSPRNDILDSNVLRQSVDPDLFDRFVAHAASMSTIDTVDGVFVPNTDDFIRSAASESLDAYESELRGQATYAQYLSRLATDKYGKASLTALADMADSKGLHVQSETLKGLVNHGGDLDILSDLSHQAADNLATTNPAAWLDDSELDFAERLELGQMTSSNAEKFGRDLFFDPKKGTWFPGVTQAGQGLDQQLARLDENLRNSADATPELAEARSQVNRAGFLNAQLKVQGSHAKVASRFSAMAGNNVAHRAFRGLVGRAAGADPSVFDPDTKSDLVKTLAGLSTDPDGWRELRSCAAGRYADARMKTNRTAREASTLAEAAHAQATEVVYDFDAIEHNVGRLNKVLTRAKQLLRIGQEARSSLAATSSGAAATALQQSYRRVEDANRQAISAGECAVEDISVNSQNMQQADQITANRFDS
ncbi:hypothetical protein [Mycobacterium sp.]|uniref:hypothetical protein n=1 Tax=Mycobacterium sp. TaxID=1785 RepID=UPI003BAB1965